MQRQLRAGIQGCIRPQYCTSGGEGIIPKSPLERPMPSFAYKGYTISPRTFQLRGSARWTLDLLIGRNGQLRAFSGPTTYTTQAGAEAACADFGCGIIDGAVHDCSVAGL